MQAFREERTGRNCVTESEHARAGVSKEELNALRQKESGGRYSSDQSDQTESVQSDQTESVQ